MVTDHEIDLGFARIIQCPRQPVEKDLDAIWCKSFANASVVNGRMLSLTQQKPNNSGLMLQIECLGHTFQQRQVINKLSLAVTSLGRLV